MSTDELDDLDFAILHLLQGNARHTSPIDMAEELPVTDTTIRNRIEKMEEAGILEGYVPKINYERAGFQLRVAYTCTAPVQRRTELAEAALGLDHVIEVEEMLSASENLHILAVTSEAEELNKLTSQIDELGLTINNEKLLRKIHLRPFNHFAENETSIGD